MDVHEVASLFALLTTPGIGYVSGGKALNAARAAGLSIADAIGRPAAELAELLPADMQDGALALSRADAKLVGRHLRSLEKLHAAGGSTLVRGETDYPASLVEAMGHGAPVVLCVLGNRDLLYSELAGVAGARRAAAESLGYAETCTRILAGRGIAIVSGAAKGIDDAAHLSALNQGGSTVLVLPHGILRYRGPEAVREGLESERALLVSEFAPDAPWATHAAIMRNVTIASLARLLCVFEPRSTGGSLRTAEAGLAQGKPVLIHCLGSDFRVERRLAAAGARILPVHEESELSACIGDAWALGRSPRREQQELF